jgi:hypothetical protein
MTLRLTIGIDPGNTGAFDMPCNPRETGTGRMIDAGRLHELLRDVLAKHQGAAVTVVLELVGGFNSDGGSFAFKFGQADGIVRGVLGSLRLPVIEVRPQAWKKHFGLVKVAGGEKPGKGASRTLVVSMFPNSALAYLRGRDDGRAEALLLALWAEATEAAA